MRDPAPFYGASLLLHLATGILAAMLIHRDSGHRNVEVVMVDLETPKQRFPAERIAYDRVMPAKMRYAPAIRDVSGMKRPEQAVMPSLSPALATVDAGHIPVAMTAAEQKRDATTAIRESGSEEITPAHARRQAVPEVMKSAPAPETTRQRYLKEQFGYIRELVTSRLGYPSQARKMGWSGMVVVTFTIAEDGSVHDIRVAESSGRALLDRSATEAVRDVAPFPRPPARTEIVLPVNFTLK